MNQVLILYCNHAVRFVVDKSFVDAKIAQVHQSKERILAHQQLLSLILGQVREELGG